MYSNGYTWLVDIGGVLQIMSTFNHQTPLSLDAATPLLCLDMWEHAYVRDYGLDKERYVSNFFDAVNWGYVETQIQELDRRALTSVGFGWKPYNK